MKEKQETTVCAFEEDCEPGLFTLKGLVLDHLHVDWRRLGSVRFQDAFVYGNLNPNSLKRVLRTSVRRASRFLETSYALECIVEELQGKERHRV